MNNTNTATLSLTLMGTQFRFLAIRYGVKLVNIQLNISKIFRILNKQFYRKADGKNGGNTVLTKRTLKNSNAIALCYSRGLCIYYSIPMDLFIQTKPSSQFIIMTCITVSIVQSIYSLQSPALHVLILAGSLTQTLKV